MPVDTAEQAWEAVVVRAARDDDGEETAWLARARAGEEAAFRWLLARYRSRVVRLAGHILRDAEEAEDAAQEAFIRAFRALPAFRGDAGFFTWLCRIVVRACLDRRRLARWKRETHGDAVIATRRQAGDGGLDQADLRLVVEQLLDRLSPPMRAAFVLRELEGWSTRRSRERWGFRSARCARD